MNLKQYVIELSKRYSIVTSLTSFVAIEKREKVNVVYFYDWDPIKFNKLIITGPTFLICSITNGKVTLS